MTDVGQLYIEAGEDNDLSTVRGRIRWARKRQSMTQDDLARAFPPGREKKRAVIGQYESGGIKPSLEVIEDLASILSVDASYIAFGQGSAQSSQARAIPLYQDDNDEPDPEHLVLPLSILTEFGAAKLNLSVVRLEVDAPLFGCRANDFLLVDIGRSEIAADGLTYVVHTTAGPALVRSEPLLTRSTSKVLQLQGGQGTSYTVAPDELEVMGCVVASLQKRL